MKGGPGDTGNKYDLTWGGREELEHQGLPGSSEMPQKSALNPETELWQHWPPRVSSITPGSCHGDASNAISAQVLLLPMGPRDADGVGCGQRAPPP